MEVERASNFIPCTCLLYEERGPCCRQFAFQQIAAGRMGFHGRLTVYYKHW